MRFKEVKSRIARSQTSSYDTIESSQSSVLHDDKEVDTTTDEMIKNSLSLRFQDKTLQRKRKRLNRRTEQKIEFNNQKKKIKNTIQT